MTAVRWMLVVAVVATVGLPVATALRIAPQPDGTVNVEIESMPEAVELLRRMQAEIVRLNAELARNRQCPMI